MDTNIAERIEIQVDDGRGMPPRTDDAEGDDRLAAFRAIETGERPPTSSQGGLSVKKSRRNALMIGASAVAVLAVAGAMFWISPYNHYTVRDASNFATHVRDLALNTSPRPAPLVAPAAELARAPAPSPAPPLYRRTPPAPTIAGDDMAEFLRLGGLDGPPTTPGATPPSLQPAASPPAPAKPTQMAVAEPPPAPPSKSGVAAPQAHPAEPEAQAPRAAPAATSVGVTEKPVVPQAVDSGAVAPATREPTPPHQPVPQDAVAKIVELRPAPMTDLQQVQVLQLVTELGTLVRDQRAEIAQLRQDQQNLGQRVDSSLTDFGRRLSMAEARGAVNAAMDPQAAPAPAAPAAAALAAPAAMPVAAKTPAPAARPADPAPARYHVQAASPGLAMLSALDASGGQEQQLPVSPGDSVPGWGKVISISQRGATWIVKTDHGVIQ